METVKHVNVTSPYDYNKRGLKHTRSYIIAYAAVHYTFIRVHNIQARSPAKLIKDHYIIIYYNTYNCHL